MVSWVPQILIPPLLALAFFRTLPRKWVLWMAPTIFLSDLDYVIPGEHRVLTHTLMLPAACLAILIAMWMSARKATGLATESGFSHAVSPLGFWEYARRPGAPVAFLLVSYYLTAHAIMDVFTGGVTLFWPLSNWNVALDLELYLDTKTNTIDPEVYSRSEDTPAEVDPHYPWLTVEHNAMLGAVLFVALIGLGVVLRRKWKARKAAVA